MVQKADGGVKIREEKSRHANDATEGRSFRFHRRFHVIACGPSLFRPPLPTLRLLPFSTIHEGQSTIHCTFASPLYDVRRRFMGFSVLDLFFQLHQVVSTAVISRFRTFGFVSQKPVAV